MEKINKIDPRNSVIDVCPKCGGRRITRWFMVPDGYDDVDWDSEEICENCDNLRNDFDQNMLRECDETDEQKANYFNNLEQGE